MKYILSFTPIFLAFSTQAHAALGRAIQQSPGGQEAKSESGGITLDGLGWFFAGFFGNIVTR